MLAPNLQLLKRAAAIDARGLSKSHKMGMSDVPVLKDATFRIESGEFVSITGPSGSGKSTLLSLLGTLDTATSGELLIEGVTVAGCDARTLARMRNERIGFVFQSFHLLPRTTAIEQVLLPTLYDSRTSPHRAEPLARECLKNVGLAGYEAHHPHQLSGGQQQRVAIARALMGRPRILLADEPTGALDQKSGSEILEIFASLNASGLTIVLVTHDPIVAASAHRIMKMRDGEIVEDSKAPAKVELLRGAK